MLKYFLCDYETESRIFEFSHVVECLDSFGNGSEFSFFCLIDTEKTFSFSIKPGYYMMKIIGYNTPIEFPFRLNNFLLKNSHIYMNVSIGPSNYKFGVLNIINESLSSSKKRLWLDMIGKNKKLYISSSLCYSGINKKTNHKIINIDGKYIVDYYSFYCEIGYSFFGKLGYMGESFDSFKDCLIELYDENEKIKVIWNDSDLSRIMIENTAPFDHDRKSIFHFIVEEMSNTFDLILK